MSAEPPKGEIEIRGYRFDASLIRAITAEARRLQSKRTEVETVCENDSD